VTGREWMDHYVKPGAAEAFTELSNDERLWVLEQFGSPCSRCGGDGDECCYDAYAGHGDDA
jgi:hypothetical protein